MKEPYTIEPISKVFGAFIHGLNLNDTIDQDTIDRIIADTHKYRLLIFKQDHKVSALRQLEISSWFGEIESTFYRHPTSPHPDIFRVSNDENEGCRNVGLSGWHIDGSFQEKPFKIQTMHFWSVSKGGATEFSPLKELILALPPDLRKRWEELYFVSSQGCAVHPLIYAHPTTEDPTMCIHTGEPFIQTFVTGFTPETMQAEEILDWPQTQAILCEIAERLSDKNLMYRREWELYDFAIVDNLAVAHRAVPETQADPKKSGLRILHRTSVKGQNKPTK